MFFSVQYLNCMYYAAIAVLSAFSGVSCAGLHDIQPARRTGFFPGRYLSEFYIQLLLLHMVFLSVSCQKQGQGTVARYIAGGSEAVLQSKEGEHQRGTCLVKEKDTCDQSLIFA